MEQSRPGQDAARREAGCHRRFPQGARGQSGPSHRTRRLAETRRGAIG
ncbi:MAG: hypothetical protein ABJA75_18410 [Bradyrhizobium sp.]